MEIHHARIVLGIVLISMLIAVLDSKDYRTWRKDRKPRIFGNRVPLNTVMTSYNKVRRKILLYHNFFRTKVDPPATNMLRMSWHSGAARDAQYWAERCRFLTHDQAESRRQPRYNSCGQNIFVASKRVPWFFATKSWFLERENFTYGSAHNSLRDVGHYTQLAWASSHRLGCGYAYCSHGGPRGEPFHNYVCNYCPAGNWNTKISTPYKVGPSCASCPRHCSSRALCTNACARADLWSNCVELARSVGKRRLCGQHDNDCAATCHCPDRIHEWMV